MARPTSPTPTPAHPRERQPRPAKAAPDRKRTPFRRGGTPAPDQEDGGGPKRTVAPTKLP